MHDDEPATWVVAELIRSGIGKHAALCGAKGYGRGLVVTYNPNQTDLIARVHRRRPSPIGCAATRRPLCANSDQATANTAGSKTSVSRRTLLAAMR